MKALHLVSVRMYWDIFEKGDLLSVLTFCSHKRSVFGHQEHTRFSKVVSRMDFFLNASLPFLCGWMKTEVSEC